MWTMAEFDDTASGRVYSSPVRASQSYHPGLEGLSDSISKQFSARERGEFLAVFRTFELRNEKEELGSNKISRDDLPSCLQELGLDATPEQIQESIPTGADSKILTLEQLAIVVLNLRPIVKVDSPRSGPRVQLRSTWNADSAHSYSHQEKAAFAHHLTALFARDPHLRARLPLAPEGDDLFEGCHDGLLLCKIVNLIEPDTVDERCLNLPRKSPGSALSVYHKVENLNLALDAARAVGCQVVNIGAHDIMEGNPILVLGLVWQLIKLQLLHSITLTEHPELVLLVDAAAGETLEAFLSLPPDKILLRWMNYHLEKANSPRRVENFGESIKDSLAYSDLLHQLSPARCPLVDPGLEPEPRAARAIANARALGSRPFLAPADVVAGNRKLNMAFVAQIFNECPGLELPPEEEAPRLTNPDYALLEADDDADTREARTFKQWINSLGLREAGAAAAGDGDPGRLVHLRDLFQGVAEGGGIALLQVMEAVRPGCVPWARVNLKAKNKFKHIENANLSLKVGNDLAIVIVNIGPYDIIDGNKKLILGIMWQLMRMHTLQILASLGGGKRVTDHEIIQWANSKVSEAGRPSSMISFRDPNLSSGRFFIDLCYAISPRTVNWEIVTDGETEEDQMNNAKYVISIARKIGAKIFIVAEDIVEVRPKLLLSFVAALWVRSLEDRAAGQTLEVPAEEAARPDAELPAAASPSPSPAPPRPAVVPPLALPPPPPPPGEAARPSASPEPTSDEGQAQGEGQAGTPPPAAPEGRLPKPAPRPSASPEPKVRGPRPGGEEEEEVVDASVAAAPREDSAAGPDLGEAAATAAAAEGAEAEGRRRAEARARARALLDASSSAELSAARPLSEGGGGGAAAAAAGEGSSAATDAAVAGVAAAADALGLSESSRPSVEPPAPRYPHNPRGNDARF